MSDQLPISPIVLIIAVGVLLVMGTLALVLYQTAFGDRARLNRRIQGMFNAGPVRRGRDPAAPKKKSITAKLKEQDAAKHGKGFTTNMREMIAQAGLSISLEQYFLFSALFAAACTGFYFLMGFHKLGLIFVPLITGLGLPRLIVGTMRKRRLAKFLLLFPDALDVIVRGIKSGLPVGECIALIGREMPDPVATEFRIISESQKMAVPMDEALNKASERVPLSELRFLAIVMTIQQQTGGNLADTLSKLSEVIRLRKKMRDKVQALSAEAKASAMIIGSLPVAVAGMLSLTAPEYIRELVVKETGNIIIIMGVVTMGCGIFVMRQMINFDI